MKNLLQASIDSDLHYRVMKWNQKYILQIIQRSIELTYKFDELEFKNDEEFFEKIKTDLIKRKEEFKTTFSQLQKLEPQIS